MQRVFENKGESHHQNQKANRPNNYKAGDGANNLNHNMLCFVQKLITVSMSHLNNIANI